MIARMSFTSDCDLMDVFSKKILGACRGVTRIIRVEGKSCQAI